MKSTITKLILGFVMVFAGFFQSKAQVDTLCNPQENIKIFSELYLAYGSTTNGYTNALRTNVTFGQALVTQKTLTIANYSVDFGLWTRYLLPPTPPVLLASQGDYKDRVKLQWNVNPLSPAATEFVILRDGSFLATVSAELNEFLDFNVQSGEYYNYSIKARNYFGLGTENFSVGFVNPNGVVTGIVSTNSGNPVPGVQVRITPLTGASMKFDGIDDQLCVSYDEEFPTTAFTVSAYVKLDANNNAGIIDWGSGLNKNWWITTTSTAQGKGYVFHIGNGSGSNNLTYIIPNEITNPDLPNQWHQITMVYNGTAMSIMVDGVFVGTQPATISRTKNLLNIGSKIGGTGYFKGNIDDVRIYNRPLTQSEVVATKNRSVSKQETGLISYWKMDEGIGEKVFDTSLKPTNANIYGAKFSTDIPEVYSAGITDVTGYYVIDGINYATSENFRATPIKNFDYNSAVEFNSADKSYGNLTNYDIPDTSTVEVLFYPFDLKSRQTVLSKGSLYELYVDNNKLFLNLNGTLTDLGTITAKYYHAVVTIDNTHNTAKVYLEGVLKTTVSFTGVSNWGTGNSWLLATNSTDAATGKFFTGLVDEVAIYKTALPQSEIQRHFVTGIPQDSTTALLYSYFDLNEGNDNKVYDYAATNFGSSVPREGLLLLANWSNNVRRAETNAHEFEPNVKVVNLNSSNTAVGNIDFKDVSTVNVSGFVRFNNTFCFEQQIEILVNGQSNIPAIYTDVNGKWSGDFEPGKTLKFSASYKDHQFSPAFFEIRKIQSPKAGVVFLDNTKRSILGQIAGGECKQSILPLVLDPNSYMVLKTESTNGCISRLDTIRNADGKYLVSNLPAIAFETKFLKHSYNNDITTFFNNKGGKLTDLKDVLSDTLDFIYTSAPKVRINTAQIAKDKCDNLIAYQTLSDTTRMLKAKFQTYEEYYGGECILDSVKYTIVNDIGDRLQETFQSDSTIFDYVSTVGVPNIFPPYTKKLEVTAEHKGSFATSTVNVIVFGMLSRPTSFTTAANPNPYLILRDPPGDKSFGQFDKGTTICTKVDRTWANSIGLEIASEWTFGEIIKTVAAPLGVGVITESGVETKLKITSNNKYTNEGQEEKEFCISTNKTISTGNSDSYYDVGTDGDVFAGFGLNFKIGLNDRLSLAADSCSVQRDTLVYVAPNGFNTEYIYTRRHINNSVIPGIQFAYDAATTPADKIRFQHDLDNWKKVMLLDSLLLANSDEGKENISFESGVNYSKAVKTAAVKALTTTHKFDSENSVALESNFEVPFLESNLSGQIQYTHGETWADANTTTDEVTFAYTFGDDEIGDNFSVDISQFTAIPNSAENAGELNRRRTEKFRKIEYPDQLWSARELDSLNIVVDELIAKARIAQTYIESHFTIPRSDYDRGKALNIYPVTASQQNAYTVFSKTNFPDYDDRQAYIAYARRDRSLNLPEFVSPSFTVVSGTTMCPHEDGTLYREEIYMSTDKNVLNNVAANTPAVFNLLIGNSAGVIQSSGVDPLSFKLAVVNGSNPKGAIIKVNGLNITDPLTFVLAQKESQNVTVTIEKGPVDYDYTELKIAFYSECEVPAGLPTLATKENFADSPQFYQEVSLDIHFVEPCSPVDINQPLQNFVSTPGDLNKINVSLVEYDLSDTDLKDISVQYRRVDGDGAWINIQKLLPAELAPLQTTIIWDTQLLRDDFYEIRAITSCNNINLAPGISTIIKGKLERLPPELVGVPQPADGIWDAGDEISITFNEAVDCDKIVVADILSNNTIGLYDATTNALVNATYTCVGNKIVIVPNINPSDFENRTFRVNISGKEYDDEKLATNPNHQAAALRDKAGNMIPLDIKWEFFVNQNNLEWVGTDIIETNTVLQPFSVKRQIRNTGGTITSFRMESVPSWLTISPATGTLNPGQLADITFTFQQDLLIGDYLANIQMVSSKGAEPLSVDYRVRCAPPVYTVSNPSEFEGSMNMVIDLSIFGVTSTDPSDIIIAKIDGQVRGVGKVAYYKNLPDDKLKWLTFMTIYGNGNDIDKPIEFHIWDGDKCNEYVEILENYTYQESALIGSPLDPTPVHVLNLVKKCIPLNKGWNWVSFNIDLGTGNNVVANVMASLVHKSGTIVKEYDGASTFELGQWLGFVDQISPTKRYMINVSEKDTVCLKGSPYTSTSFPIAINLNWNWIGYVPSTGMTVTQAMRGLAPLNGDIIKSQTLFAQYVAGVGWIGNLSFLEPQKGYMLKISNLGTLVYNTSTLGNNFEGNFDDEKGLVPKFNERNLGVQAELETQLTDDFTKYQETMNVIGEVKGIKIDKDDELRAYINGKLAGANKPILFDKKESLFFQTIYFDFEQNVSFKIYKADRKKEYELDKTVLFKPETYEGLVENPVVFNVISNGLAPILISIPDQVITSPATVFPNVSIANAVSGQSANCASFAFNTILPSGSAVKPTCTSPTGFEGNMTGVMKIVYNEHTNIASSDDVITFVDPTTQAVLGCATYNSTFKLFTYTVKGGISATETPVDISYYSDQMHKVFLVKSGVMYKNNKVQGSFTTPYEVNVSPISLTMAAGVITPVLNDPTFVGQFGVTAFALNCPGFDDGQTTFNFQRNAASALPVHLISFEGKSTDLGNELTWKTISEKNFSHFEIERSNGATNLFSKIGTVKGVNNSKENLSYQFLDELKEVGMVPGATSTTLSNLIVYYRLKMIDLDGKTDFSKIIAIDNSPEKDLVGNFYPNPTTGKTYIEIVTQEKGNWNITFYDVTGKIIKIHTHLMQKGKNKVTFENLSKGVNFVRFESGLKSEIRKVIQE
jgi:Concanavalin A-like lectin/glucanases superfamily/Secretion system C-terminal sorting domain